MDQAPAPPRLPSLYRGQSKVGIGEGPGRHVPHGEQYLAADPPFAGDAELLATIQPWMSLDSKPGDRQTLGAELEGWSCFAHGGWRFVARHADAGLYDRRAAYFTHARAWAAADLAGGFDPGAYLGRSEVFDRPWRDGAPGQRVEVPPPGLVRPEQVGEEAEVAERLLAHLYQAMVLGYPVVLAVPVAEFRAGGPLHALVSFARAALPLAVKRDCRIRVYTRLPDLFLRHLAAHLIAVPEDEAGNALLARRDAALLDRQGRRRDGREAGPEARGYARAVVQRARRIPEGLLPFSGRVSRHPGLAGLPSAEEVEALPIVYNLAAAIATGSEAQLADLLTRFLVKTANQRASGLPWQRLLEAPGEGTWRFPDQALLDAVLSDPATPYGRDLQRRLEDEAAGRGLTIPDPRLVEWFSAAAGERLERLGQLAERGLAAPGAVARLTCRLPLARLLALGDPAGLLQAEAAAGVIGERAAQPAELVRLGQNPRGLAVLLEATAAGALAPAWLAGLLREGEGETVVRAAQRLLPLAFSDPRLREFRRPLLQRLLALGPKARPLKGVVREAADRLGPGEDPAAYLHLAELLNRIDPEGANPLRQRLLDQLGDLRGPEDRRYLVEVALSDAWSCLTPETLLTADGEPSFPWAGEVADLLLSSGQVRRALATHALVRLGNEILGDQSPLAAELAQELDHRAGTDLPEATDALIRRGAWHRWRRHSGLAAEPGRAAALAWLTAPAWRGAEAPPATLEAWKQAVRDLEAGGGLDAAAAAQLIAEGRRWPWITPFEEEQLADLARLAQDLGTLADLGAGLGSSPNLPFPVREHLLAHAPFAAGLPPTALAWLAPAGGGREPPPLDLAQARTVLRHAGHRRQEAEAALRAAVVHAFRDDPLAAARAATEFDLWREARVVEQIAAQLCRRGSVQAIGREALGLIEDQLASRPLRLATLQPSAAALARELARAGYPHTAALLSRDAAADHLVERALAALRQGSVADPCWQEMLAAGPAAEDHPLSRLAARLRARGPEGPASWDTFLAVIEHRPRLLAVEPRGGSLFPVLQLAAALRPGLGMGGVAADLLRSRAARGDHTSDPSWWRGLGNGLERHFQRARRPADDRLETALAVVHLAARGLDSRERAAREEGLPTADWPPRARGATP